MRDVLALVENIVAQAVNDYRKIALYEDSPVYAWFTPGFDMPGSGKREVGRVYIAHNKPWDNAELVTGERIPGDRSYDGIKAWINDRMGSIPIL